MKKLAVVIAAALSLCVTGSAQAYVIAYANPGCDGAGGYRNLHTGNYPNLHDEYYTGTTTHMDQNISSIYIYGPYRVTMFDWQNYGGSHTQTKNYDGSYDSGYCLTFYSSSWSTYSPQNDDISSITVEYNTIVEYFDFHGYRERSSDAGNGKWGVIEVFDGPQYTGSRYYMTTTETSDDITAQPIDRNTRSVRLYGDVTAALCLNDVPNCADYVYVDKKQVGDLYDSLLDATDEVTGIRLYNAQYGSVFVTIASDFNEQGREAALVFADQGPGNGQYLMKRGEAYWDDSWAGPDDDMPWSSAANFDTCNEAGGSPPASTECQQHVGGYLDLFTDRKMEFTADASLVLIAGHGHFEDGSADDAARIAVMSTTVAQYAANDLESIRWFSNDLSPNGDRDYNLDWGNHNTDWILTFACDSLGTGETSVTELDVRRAWLDAFESGVHAIGGFEGPSKWLTGPNANAGTTIANRFWNEVKVNSVAKAWGEMAEVNRSGDDRVMDYMSAETCDCDVPSCWDNSRHRNERYWGYGSGPMADPSPTNIYVCLKEYGP